MFSQHEEGTAHVCECVFVKAKSVEVIAQLLATKDVLYGTVHDNSGIFDSGVKMNIPTF